MKRENTEQKMNEQDKNKNALIPVGANQLKKVSNIFAITDKLLIGEIEQLFNEAFYLINSADLTGIEENYCKWFELDKNYYKRKNFKYKAKNKDDYKKAIALFIKVLKIKPKHYFSCLNKGIAKANLTDYEGAIEDYNKAIEIDPNYSYAYNNRGVAKNNLKDYEGAIEDCNKAIENDPDFVDAYIDRECAKRHIKDYDILF